MSSTQSLCTSFKKELFEAIHDFNSSGGHTFKLALYTSSASMSATTTAYSSTNEISATNYTAGGKALTNVDPTTSGTTAYVDFADVSWTSTDITGARYGLIYNDTAVGDPAVAVLDFGSDRSHSGGTFSVTFPTASASSAIVRLA